MTAWLRTTLLLDLHSSGGAPFPQRLALIPMLLIRLDRSEAVRTTTQQQQHGGGHGGKNKREWLR